MGRKIDRSGEHMDDSILYSKKRLDAIGYRLSSDPSNRWFENRLTDRQSEGVARLPIIARDAVGGESKATLKSHTVYIWISFRSLSR